MGMHMSRATIEVITVPAMKGIAPYSSLPDVGFQAVEVMNKAGNFIEPTLGSFTAAASAEMPADTRIMITNSDNPEAYPITSFTWIIMYKEQGYADRTRATAEATVNAVAWLTGENAQAIASSVHYAPLPQKASEQAALVLKGITYEGQPIMK